MFKFLSVFLSLKGVLPLCCQVPNAQDIHHQRKINESVVCVREFVLINRIITVLEFNNISDM